MWAGGGHGLLLLLLCFILGVAASSAKVPIASVTNVPAMYQTRASSDSRTRDTRTKVVRMEEILQSAAKAKRRNRKGGAPLERKFVMSV